MPLKKTQPLYVLVYREPREPNYICSYFTMKMKGKTEYEH